MNKMDRSKEIIEGSLSRLENWIARHDYKGYEPFDGLTSFLFPMTFGAKLPCQILQQIVRRSPLNLRPFLGIKPLDSTKGRGYIAWGFLNKWLSENREVDRKKALDCLDWLDKNKSPFYEKHSWGNHFLYVSRGGFIDKFEPTIVWTGLIGQVFIDAYSLFKEVRHRQIIESIADWMMSLPREETKSGTCMSYVMPRQSSVHNSNMIGAAFLAGAAAVTKEMEYAKLAHRAMEYSCSRQRGDGAWYYGEESKYHWIDSFHTGYNLDALKRYQHFTGDTSFSVCLEKGLDYFVGSFFEPSGRVNYYHNRTGPIDIQCASQAIDTLLMFSSESPQLLPMAQNTARWYIKNMQSNDGHFYFRRYPLGFSNRTPMIHWGQATMYKALANLVLLTKRISIDV